MKKLDEMVDAVKGPMTRVEEFCKACMDGKYPTGDITASVLKNIESERSKERRQGT